MTGAELASVVNAARSLIAYSDARDREAAACLAARAEGYIAGYEAGDHAARADVHEWYAEQDRQIAADIARLPARPAHAERAAARWHVCCRDCRRAGCRKDCPRCETRTLATYALPHPDDFTGRAPRLAEARGAA